MDEEIKWWSREYLRYEMNTRISLDFDSNYQGELGLHAANQLRWKKILQNLLHVRETNTHDLQKHPILAGFHEIQSGLDLIKQSFLSF